MDRRHFQRLLGLSFATSLLQPKLRNGFTMEPLDQTKPIAVATWSFGLEPVRKATAVMLDHQHRLDAVEQGIHITEADAENRSVGIGGIPNADGVVELDACIMDGEQRRAGSVASLRDFPHPISVARKVMELTPHVMLVGQGANDFAANHGFTKADLLIERERQAYQQWKSKQPADRRAVDPVGSQNRENHDTIALLVRDAQGQLAGGCSTSGWGYKLPGRVGDSPIIGSGLYVDDDAGAAGATGLGEIMMRYCGSFLVVEAMRRGASPEDACIEAVQRILKGERKPATELSVNFVAISKDGQVGAAGTDEGFRYCVAIGDQADVRQPTRCQ